MRFLALETDAQQIAKRYTVDEEQQLLLSRFHPVVFWVRLIVSLLIFTVLGGLFLWADQHALLPEAGGYIILGIVVAISGYHLLQAFISYHYNFILVTTEKVLCVRHTMFWKQEVNPTHIDNVISTKQESQFLGLLNCGTVILNLRERTDYSTKQFVLRYVPFPNKVAGSIENAIALFKQGDLQPH